MNTQILINKINEDEILNNISRFFDNEIYLVGGSVRDYILGKVTWDRDLVVVGIDGREFSLKVAEFLGGKFIPLDETNKIYRVVLADKINYLDITNPVGGTIENDLLRRDLTINAVAVNIKTGKIVDVTSGLADLSSKVIKGVKEENFVDDPLRILRIFRFYAIYGFEIDEELLNISIKYADLILKPAKERVEYELMKMLSGEYAHLALLKMDKCGILEKIFPFVSELKQVPPNLHHHLDLFNHSVEVVKQVGILYQQSSDIVKHHMDRVDFGGFSRLSHLRLASFLHDIGKFSTWTIDSETNRPRFIKHEEVGSKMVKPLLKKMCFSNKQIEYISLMVKNHMYPSAVVSSPILSDKVMMRFVRKMEEDAIDDILIAQADRLSARGPEITEDIVDENISSLNKLLDFYVKAKETLKPLPKLLDGIEIMQILNIKPSKKLGEIINKLNEAQISGDITTKEEAISFVKTLA